MSVLRFFTPGRGEAVVQLLGGFEVQRHQLSAVKTPALPIHAIIDAAPAEQAPGIAMCCSDPAVARLVNDFLYDGSVQ